MQQVAGDREPEAFATCPYNPAHRVPLFRMKRHLVKCRINNLDLVIVTCPLNIEHRVPQPELTYHVEQCPDRVNLERKVHIPEVIDRQMELEVEAPDLTSAIDDCWDDAQSASYDPTKSILRKPILRILTCESKGKRREFRADERMRIARLNEVKTSQTSKTNAALMAMESGTQCRRPFTHSAFANKGSKDLDPYKINDMLHALDKDQKRLLDNIQTMGDHEELVVFPIEDSAQKAEVNENSEHDKNSVRSSVKSRYHSVLGIDRSGSLGTKRSNN